MQCVILSAGKGSRLQPITLTRSKAMAPVVGKPIVERVMETILQNGIHDFILVINGQDSEIRDHFQKHSRLKAKVQFVIQPKRLGMANALRLAAPYIQSTFVMSACDNLTPPDHIAQLLQTHQRARAQATLSLMEIDPALVERTGIVDFHDGQVRRIVEKPTRAEAPSNISSLPLYVFSPTLLDYLPEIKISPRGEYELQDAIQLLIDRNHRVTGAFTNSRLQLTNAADLLALNRHYLANGNSNLLLGAPQVGSNTKLIPPVHIEEGAVIGANCTIGPYVYIERNCHIGTGVVLKDVVVLRKASIEDGQTVIGTVIA